MKWLPLIFLTFLVAHADPRREWILDMVRSSDIREVLETGSMKPTLDENSYVLVRDLPFSDLKVGDIVVYRARGRLDGYTLIAHRIVRMSSGGSALVVRGDANREEDYQIVVEADYVGRVIGWVAKN